MATFAFGRSGPGRRRPQPPLILGPIATSSPPPDTPTGWDGAGAPPVRPRPPIAHIAPFLVTDAVGLTLAEEVRLDKWFTPLSEPVRLPRRLLPLPALRSQPTSNPATDFATPPVNLDSYYTPLGVPVRPRFNAARFMAFYVVDPLSLTLHEAPQLDKFYTPLSEPPAHRLVRRMRVIPPLRTEPVSNPTDFPAPPLAGFDVRLSAPVVRRANVAAWRPFHVIDPTALLQREATTLDRWYTPLSLPRFTRRPLLLPPLRTEPVSNPFNFPPDPVAQLRPYEVLWPFPVRPRFNSAPWQRFHAIDPKAMLAAERVFWDALQEGMGGVPALRHPRRRKDTHTYPCAFLVLDRSQLAESISGAALESMRAPLRQPPRLRGNALGALQLDQGQLAEAIFASAWWAPLSVPVPGRRRPALPWLSAIGETYDADLFALAFVVLYPWRMLAGGLE